MTEYSQDRRGGNENLKKKTFYVLHISYLRRQILESSEVRRIQSPSNDLQSFQVQ